MRTLIILSLIFAAFFMNACKKSMASTSIEKSLIEFDTISLQSVFEVYLTQGTENSIRLEGAEKIIEDIDVKIEKNTLSLENKFKGNWIHPKNNKVKVYITTNGLARINSYETCNIKTTNTLLGNEIGLVMTSKLNEATLDLNCNSFYFWNNFPCGGKVVLTGTTYELKLWNYALMSVDASGLVSSVATIDNFSKGDCSVNCLQKIMYSIRGTGNIYLQGNPPEMIKMEESSTGKLIIQ
jgi:hypothetical protein